MDMGKDFGNTGDGFSNERRPIGVERLPAAASRGAIAWPRHCNAKSRGEFGAARFWIVAAS